MVRATPYYRWDCTGLYCVHSYLFGVFAMSDNQNLIPTDTWQTQQRGDNDSEYQVYVACAESLGWTVKTYDEWLRS